VALLQVLQVEQVEQEHQTQLQVQQHLMQVVEVELVMILAQQ